MENEFLYSALETSREEHEREIEKYYKETAKTKEENLKLELYICEMNRTIALMNNEKETAHQFFQDDIFHGNLSAKLRDSVCEYEPKIRNEENFEDLMILNLQIENQKLKEKISEIVLQKKSITPKNQFSMEFSKFQKVINVVSDPQNVPKHSTVQTDQVWDESQMNKLFEIEEAVKKLEKKTKKVEQENNELLLEKREKENAFIAISNQLGDMNSLLDSLTDAHRSDGEEIERLKKVIAGIKNRDADFGDYKTLIESLTNAKDMAFAELMQCKQELVDRRQSGDKENQDVGTQIRNFEDAEKQNLVEANKIEEFRALNATIETLRDDIKQLQHEMGETEKDRDSILEMYSELKPIQFECEQLESLLQIERQHNQELEQYVIVLNSVRANTDMQKTIEQQYALIGEMDMEQSRLMVENCRLRSQLCANERIL